MRNGLLLAVVLCLASNAQGLAQTSLYRPMSYPAPPGYRPMPYQPGYPAPGYGGYQRRGLLIGAPLSRNGPVRLDSFRHARPVSPEQARMPLRAVYPNQPRPMVHRPASQTAFKQDEFNHTSRKFVPGTVNHNTSAPIAAAAAPCDDCMEVPGEIVDEACFEEPAYAGGDWLNQPYPERYPRGYRFYGNLEALYVIWEQQEIPALLNITTAGNPPLVVGNGDVPGDDGSRQGGRATAGVWLNRCNTWGIEATGMFLVRDSTNAAFLSTANAGVSRLFVNTDGTLGAVAVNQAAIATSQEVWGGEANLRRELIRGCWGHLDLIGGMRYFTLREDLTISDFTSGANVTSRFDNFGAVNRLYTGQIGLDSEIRLGRLYTNIWAKCGIGVNEQNISVNGGTSVTGAGGTVNAPAGLLTQASNIGSRSDNDLSVIAEAGLRLGVLVTNNIRISGGYNILYISSVARPGNQVDFAGNIIPSNPPRPLFLFRDDSIWAHLFSAELEWRF